MTKTITLLSQRVFADRTDYWLPPTESLDIGGCNYASLHFRMLFENPMIPGESIDITVFTGPVQSADWMMAYATFNYDYNNPPPGLLMVPLKPDKGCLVSLRVDYAVDAPMNMNMTVLANISYFNR